MGCGFFECPMPIFNKVCQVDTDQNSMKIKMVNNFQHLQLHLHIHSYQPFSSSLYIPLLFDCKIRRCNNKMTYKISTPHLPCRIFFSSGRSSCSPQGVVMDYMTAVVAVTQVLVWNFVLMYPPTLILFRFLF